MSQYSKGRHTTYYHRYHLVWITLVSDFVKKVKGRSSRKVQMEFPELKKRYWSNHFWGRGYFSSTSGNVTDEIINEYINNHTDAHRSDNQNNISLE